MKNLTHVKYSIQKLMNKLSKRRAKIIAESTTKFKVVDNENNVIIDDCPILTIVDKQCQIKHCPFNNKNLCVEVKPPEKYNDFRPRE